MARYAPTSDPEDVARLGGGEVEEEEEEEMLALIVVVVVVALEAKGLTSILTSEGGGALEMSVIIETLLK